MPGPLSRPHFGEIDDKEPSDPPDITDAECQEPDDDEDTPADPDVVSMLGFDPDELFSGDESSSDADMPAEEDETEGGKPPETEKDIP